MRTITNHCSRCGADLHEKKITYTQEIDGRVHLIEDVPAFVCLQCGEQYLLPKTVNTLQETIEQGKASDTITVPVYQYPSL